MHTCNKLHSVGRNWMKLGRFRRNKQIKTFTIVPIQCIVMIKIVFFSPYFWKRQNCAKKEIALTFNSMYSITLLWLGCCLRNTEHSNSFKTSQCNTKKTATTFYFAPDMIWIQYYGSLFYYLFCLFFFFSIWCYCCLCCVCMNFTAIV